MEKSIRFGGYMFAIVTPETIQLPPGTVMRFPGSWQDYQTLRHQLGDRATPRIKYRPGEILLMSPLPSHGRTAHLIAQVVMVLLDHLARDYEAFTPITMDLPEVRGIEPDYCFYIDRWAAVAGKNRIDWESDPPPDLVIEIDITSFTDADDYLPYRVPEVWLYQSDRLKMYGLQDDRYELQSQSRYFPNFNLAEILGETFQIARDRNTSSAIRALRQKLSA
jgi:Uma2 family endonuclease